MNPRAQLAALVERAGGVNRLPLRYTTQPSTVTLRNWLAGRHPIPHDAARKIAHLYRSITPTEDGQ